MELFISLFVTNYWEYIDRGCFLYLNVRENVSMDAAAGHSVTFFFFKSKKEICDSLTANTVAFWDDFVWFNVVLQWRERKDQLCTAAWISG